MKDRFNRPGTGVLYVGDFVTVRNRGPVLARVDALESEVVCLVPWGKTEVLWYGYDEVKRYTGSVVVSMGPPGPDGPVVLISVEDDDA